MGILHLLRGARRARPMTHRCEHKDCLKSVDMFESKHALRAHLQTVHMLDESVPLATSIARDENHVANQTKPKNVVEVLSLQGEEGMRCEDPNDQTARETAQALVNAGSHHCFLLSYATYCCCGVGGMIFYLCIFFMDASKAIPLECFCSAGILTNFVLLIFYMVESCLDRKGCGCEVLNPEHPEVCFGFAEMDSGFRRTKCFTFVSASLKVATVALALVLTY